jgi:hypothetical protein
MCTSQTAAVGSLAPAALPSVIQKPVQTPGAPTDQFAVIVTALEQAIAAVSALIAKLGVSNAAPPSSPPPLPVTAGGVLAQTFILKAGSLSEAISSLKSLAQMQAELRASSGIAGADEMPNDAEIARIADLMAALAAKIPADQASAFALKIRDAAVAATHGMAGDTTALEQVYFEMAKSAGVAAADIYAGTTLIPGAVRKDLVELRSKAALASNETAMALRDWAAASQGVDPGYLRSLAASFEAKDLAIKAAYDATKKAAQGGGDYATQRSAYEAAIESLKSGLPPATGFPKASGTPTGTTAQPFTFYAATLTSATSSLRRMADVIDAMMD